MRRAMVAELFHRLRQALLAAAGAEEDREHADLEAGRVEAADLRRIPRW